MAVPFVKSPNHTPARGRRIDLVVIHTMETPERPGAAEAVAHWFSQPRSEVSAHYCVDADSIVQCVREVDIAWHARGANGRSIGVELAGFAKQTADRWGDAYSRAMLRRAARLVAEICERHDIPPVWLDADDLRDGRPGITGHAQVSDAFERTDHWDPGPAFPVERFLRLVVAALGGQIEAATWSSAERSPPASSSS